MCATLESPWLHAKVIIGKMDEVADSDRGSSQKITEKIAGSCV